MDYLIKDFATCGRSSKGIEKMKRTDTQNIIVFHMYVLMHLFRGGKE